MKIFITLGSQKFQFNRMLQAIDRQVKNGKIAAEIFAQIGVSDYKPESFKYKEFLGREEFAEEMSASDIVITHGGTGAIIGALKKGKKVIAIPRLAKYGEHVDDHQLQLIEQFRELHLIKECQDCDDIAKALEEVQNTEYNKYESNTATIIEDIENFLHGHTDKK